MEVKDAVDNLEFLYKKFVNWPNASAPMIKNTLSLRIVLDLIGGKYN